MINYFYHTANGQAALHIDGKPLKKFGKFKTEIEARKVCQKHYEKACKAARNFNRPEPITYWM